MPWEDFLSDLELDCEYSDPLYEQTSSGEELLNLCFEVENTLLFWLEPSVQAGQGGIWIYSNDTDETLAEDIDYEGFNNDVIDLAFESTSEGEFKQKYKEYLLNLVD